MKQDDIMCLTLWLTREVAKLHAKCVAYQAVVEELRIIDPRLDKINAAQIEVDAHQKFYEVLEKINPEIAAMIDSRTPREVDVKASPDDEFPV